MALMVWDNGFSVNVKEIDAQHQKLIALINDLHDAMKTGKAKDVLGKVLSDLTDYTVYHFGVEEKLFQTHGYPEAVQHKREHDALTKQVLDIKEKFKEGKAGVTVETMAFLKDWLTNHIKKTDKKYTPFLNGKGVV
ncbi:MAG: bacteriohemerythrin [Nitrospirae bacterium]|nr:bacteriohemerythrin [Nitrospirota bacterium]